MKKLQLHITIAARLFLFMACTANSCESGPGFDLGDTDTDADTDTETDTIDTAEPMDSKGLAMEYCDRLTECRLEDSGTVSEAARTLHQWYGQDRGIPCWDGVVIEELSCPGGYDSVAAGQCAVDLYNTRCSRVVDWLWDGSGEVGTCGDVCPDRE
jgi:hypothetical protein